MKTEEEKYNWYDERIEKPVREIVKKLRNNGINTTCSCGHDMTIQCEYYDVEEFRRIYDILFELNIKEYQIIVTNRIREGHRNTFMDIMFPDKNGNYSYELKDNEDFIRNVLK